MGRARWLGVATAPLALAAWPPCLGKQVHDANVVATMLVHGIDPLVTMNAVDFERFARRIRVLGL